MDSAAQGVAWGLLAGLVAGGFALAVLVQRAAYPKS
jgi:hypothetical protein